MSKDIFSKKPDISPKIYAYSDIHYPNSLKVGYTVRNVEERLKEHYPTVLPGNRPYRIELEEHAMRNDGTSFTDHRVHELLIERGVKHLSGEWFECEVKDVKDAIITIKEGRKDFIDRSENFRIRKEQADAVKMTMDYFDSVHAEDANRAPHFLWNAKMRFGKTFAAYQLAKRMNWKKVLVLTFKPAVQTAWKEDLLTHIDFNGWQFISKDGLSYEEADKDKPIVCFGSFQDFLGKNKTGGIKAKNEWAHTINWDCVIFDEYHFGAWRENAQELFEAESKAEKDFALGNGIEYFDEDILPITTDHYLYLSGTPFRAIATGEFIEEQIFNWTYSDEQKAKAEWEGDNNPYLSLPEMVMFTYQLPPAIKDIVSKGEFDEFDLNEFFFAEGNTEDAMFKHENEVQKWLDMIRGAFLPMSQDNLKLGAKRPPMPFSDVRLLSVLSHTFWFLPSVASCHAMSNLLKKRQNTFYQDYKIIVAAGPKAGIGVKALEPVVNSMGNPLESKTITLSCGKLTTGVTVRPWSGIFMLRNLSTPETYFQSAFRVQSPWTIKNLDGLSPNQEEVIKEKCYVFDFAPERALRQVADYSCRLNVNEISPEKKVEEFISFLPILSYDGFSMRRIDAAGILDMAMSGTTATLLARRWESALLVNVDNFTLKRLMTNSKAMNALMSIEGFRNLNQDLETIINKSEKINELKKVSSDRDLNNEEKKVLTQEEKEFKSIRKEIQEKLVKLATRIPIFMYLTDFREEQLKDVIMKVDSALFKKVTGLTVDDFELLVELNVFDAGLMNDAVYKFRRYEDSSLEYTGINRHKGESVGLYDRKVTDIEYQTFLNVAEWPSHE